MTQDVLNHLHADCPVCKSFWINLVNSPQLGVNRILSHCRHHQISVHELAESKHKQLISLGFKPEWASALSVKQHQFIRRCNAWEEADDQHMICVPGDRCYPNCLLEISSPPAALFVKGNAGRLLSRQLAMIGSRKPTPSGKANAIRLARQAVESGWTVTSGLALGIDGHCHQSALDANGQTIAVLGSGIDHIYPRRHIKLYQQIIAEGGAVISEFAFSEPPRAENFPRRNRIVSGMSLGTLVVEAALKSGSLITARYALEQNREVFAVPGNVSSAVSQGCHFLIKQGAKLVEDIQDVNDEFQQLSFSLPAALDSGHEKKQNGSLAYDQLLDSVEHDVTSIDVIAERSNLPIHEVMATLLEYELRGLVTAVPGGYIKLGES